MNWFRVEIRNGKAAAIRKVDAAGSESGVYYVKATNEFAAQRKAENRYRYLLLDARRKAYEQEGKCRCGRARDAEGKRCLVCLERGHAATVRYRERKISGKDHDGGRALRMENQTRTIRDRRNELRIETLIEVQAALKASGSLVEFTHWLRGEIKAAVQPRTEAAE